MRGCWTLHDGGGEPLRERGTGEVLLFKHFAELTSVSAAENVMGGRNKIHINYT